MSDISKQPSLFYHLGVRESFDMANNVILYHDTDADASQSLKDMVSQKNTVNKVLRNHLIRPHWMFAMDNIILRAVQAAVTILIPELRVHFEPASETEGGDKDGDEEEASCQPTEQNGAEDPTITAGGSTLIPVVSHEGQQQLILELGRLKQETLRLLEHLVQKEKEYQTLLQQSLEQKTQELHLLQLKLKPKDSQWSAAAFRESADPELMNWLKQQGAVLDAIKRFAEEDYTLSAVLNDITKDDLQCLQLRGGLLCRIWNAILNHRQTAEKISVLQKVNASEGEYEMGISK